MQDRISVTLTILLLTLGYTTCIAQQASTPLAGIGNEEGGQVTPHQVTIVSITSFSPPPYGRKGVRFNGFTTDPNGVVYKIYKHDGKGWQPVGPGLTACGAVTPRPNSPGVYDLDFTYLRVRKAAAGYYRVKFWSHGNYQNGLPGGVNDFIIP